MNVLVTGADGFVGKNLIISLKRNSDIEIVRYTRNNTLDELTSFVDSADFIFHLAGVNRPESDSEFKQGNADLTFEICNRVKATGRDIPIVLSSSIQAERDNAYGQSKLLAETHLLNLHNETGNKVYLYRLPNVFGKWCKPNYNSVVATFCNNIANNLPIQINDENAELDLVHIGTVVTSFLDVLFSQYKDKIHIDIEPIYKVTLGELASKIYDYKNSRESLITERVGDGFERVLYATYISYIKPDDFGYEVKQHKDPRGRFVEMLKTKDSGQFSFFTAHPGITRGGHYHHCKTEKFLVIKGKARFGFRHIITDEMCELITTGDEAKIVETVPGWSHDITNIGDDELIVMLWANENFDPETPDTVAYKV
ncbi:UDP-2-acetamido-2,6-beta-L-arabino-hexul-4-ose reductase [Pseudoalteromonas aurantia]|uniref:Capsular biosynthesis protein n=1 Tax=Pseudoalteromonas aurantia 208 TaxID=1314867 RepID=A0ABR9EE32_9GAMM|nr:NAD-dependent epimerase/dehydratase family protein [Pseudoalteromonas aurantia]MBE0369252.1 hypothetical protein [Pseudoalteromonas aurantia 208]